MGSKRGNGEGSIYQRKDGLWIGAISIGRDTKWKNKKKDFFR